MKKLISTILIIIGIAISFIVVGVAILAISPKTNIFGYYFVSDKTEINKMIDGVDSSTLKNLNITADKIELTIEKADVLDNAISVQGKSNFMGLVKARKGEDVVRTVEIDDDYKASTGTLELSTKEPNGFILKTKLYLKIIVGSDVSLNNLTINVNGSNFAIADDVNISTNNLVINKNSTNGSLNIGNLNVKNNIEISNQAGQIDLTKANTDNANVTLKTRIGTFTLGNVKDLKVESPVAPYVTVGNIYGELDYVADSGKINTGVISGSTSIRSNSASVNINTLSSTFLVKDYKGDGTPKNMSLYIKNIGTEGGQKQIINLNRGSIKIDNVYVPLALETGSGDINIGTEGTSNIKISSDVNLKTASGNINAYFNSNKVCTAVIESNTGRINVYGLNVGSGSSIKTTSESIIYVEIAKLSNNILLSGQYSKPINVKVNELQSINYNVSTKKGRTISMDVLGQDLRFEAKNLDQIPTTVANLTPVEQEDTYGFKFERYSSASTINIITYANVKVEKF